MTRKLVLCLALVFTAGTVRAAAPAEPGEPVGASAAAAPDAGGIDAALASGDLGAAREQAEAARKAKPGADTWAAEAEVCEREADLACAKAARTQQRELTREGSPERAAVTAKLAALEDMSRGTVEDEPASTRRGELDRARSERAQIKRPPPKVDLAPAKTPPPRERIVKKWYFWVTILAITASAAAITAIGIKSARDEQHDDLDASGGRVRLGTGPALRF